MKTKSRAEQGLVVHPSHTVHDGSGNLITSGPWYGSYTMPPGSSESITYNSGRFRFNDCVHQKYRYTRNRTRNLINSSSGNTLRIYDHHGFGDYDWRTRLPSAPGPSLGVNQLLLRAIQNIKPKLKAELSVPNFLFELRDLRRLLPTRERVNQIAELIRNGSWSGRTGGAIDEVASQHLNANFGYLPLISDCFNFTTAIESFNHRLKDFIKYGKKPQTGHYKEVVEGHIPYTLDSWNNHERGWVSTFETSDVTWTVTLRYSYSINIPILSTPELFQKYIGFRGNPRILWDAIPFSFIVDWILKVGKALESFDDGAIPISWIIHDACMSNEYKGVVKNYVFGVGSDPWQLGLDRALESTEGFEMYSRQVMTLDSRNFLDIPPLPVVDGLSPKELILGLALGRTLTR